MSVVCKRLSMLAAIFLLISVCWALFAIQIQILYSNNQVYAEMFLEFREEAVAQAVIQWVKLFPLVRLRVND